MTDLNWRDAIIKVLQDSDYPLPYGSITQRIIDGKLKTKIGATPAASVAATLSSSLKNEGAESPFARVDRGVYGLRAQGKQLDGLVEADLNEVLDDIADEMGLINAFGMFWKRSEVRWKKPKPELNGFQQVGSEPVNFCEQMGVYLLHDGSRVIYVGQVGGPRLGQRLREHTLDRLSGRWDRFSWFGVRMVTEKGKLAPAPESFTLANLITTMEALLIEGLEPPQNRRQGDGFNAVEFLQAGDPEIAKQRKQALLDEMSSLLSR